MHVLFLPARTGAVRLTLHTDYALRVLIHLAAHSGRLCSIGEIARAYGISQNHLMKVVNSLAHAGYLETIRGRGGGIRLAHEPSAINIGEVVRLTEEGLSLADCNSCAIAPACGLTGALREALAAFLRVLDGKTLADIASRKEELARLLVGPG